MIQEKASPVKLEHAGLDENTRNMLQKLKIVTVIGSGTMGNGICHVFAQSGFNVHMMDINQAAMDKALATIGKNMDRQVAKSTLTEEAKAEATRAKRLMTAIEWISEGKHRHWKYQKK